MFLLSLSFLTKATYCESVHVIKGKVGGVWKPFLKNGDKVGSGHWGLNPEHLALTSRLHPAQTAPLPYLALSGRPWHLSKHWF